MSKNINAYGVFFTAFNHLYRGQNLGLHKFPLKFFGYNPAS